jgi:hypothetical protein
MKLKYLFISILSLLILSCDNKQDLNGDFKMEIPNTADGGWSGFHYFQKNEISKQLNIPDLRMGVDSFELRLWVDVEGTNGGQLYRINKIDNNWICLEYSFTLSSNHWDNKRPMWENYLDFKIDSFYVKNKKPQTNWGNFLQALEEEDIYSLQNQMDIENWENIVSDGYSFSVEFATKKLYKFYSYNCPDVYQETFTDCEKMSNILTIFDDEIGFDLIFGPRCSKE